MILVNRVGNNGYDVNVTSEKLICKYIRSIIILVRLRLLKSYCRIVISINIYDHCPEYFFSFDSSSYTHSRSIVIIILFLVVNLVFVSSR